MWVAGTDGATSNVFYFVFSGGSMTGYTDPSTGKMYYYYSGGGSPSTPGTIHSLNADGTPDATYGPFLQGSPAFTFDPGTGYVFLTDGSGINVNVLKNPSLAYNIPVGEVAAFDTNSGLVCAVQPNTDTAYCFMAAGVSTSVVVATIGFPKGSQPAAVKVFPDGSIVVFTRGNSTLSWFAISGSTATPTGTLVLPEFTNADATYWQTYHWTGGGNMVLVNGTLGVMGYVVNADGTVSQKLALVDIAAHTVNQYADLPAGTVFLAADPTNNAIVAEYPDFSVSPPVTRFERIYVDTGNATTLTSTSTLVPGAAIFVTQGGNNILICVSGGCDLQPNQ